VAAVEVLGMGLVLEAGRAQGMVMGLEVVALMVAGMVLEASPVILLLVAGVEEVAVALVAMGHTHHLTPDEEPTMGDGVGLESMRAGLC